MKTDLDDRVAPVLVLGIGNTLLADDGVGLALLEALRSEVGADPRVEFVDGGTQGLLLLGLLEGRRALLLLDAVRRDAAPGSVHLVPEADRIAIPRDFGAHGGNASELLASARMLGVLPEDVHLVGIEPAEVRTYCGLSPRVQAAVPAAVAVARLQLRDLFAEQPDTGALACTS